MGKFAAYLNAALAAAWLALFFTNDALFVSHEVELSDHLRGDAFAMAWAGSAICSRLYIALVNYGLELKYATAIFCIPSIGVGVLAALATSSFTSLAWAMVLLDLKILANALQGKLKVGGVIHALYTVAGVALFMTGESPVMRPGVEFLGDKFRMAWAGWKMCGCFYYALVNLGVDLDLAMVAAMLPYALCDEFAAMDGACATASAFVCDRA